MGTFLNSVFAIILLIIWIIAGGFVTQANVFLTKFRKDSKINQAWWYTFGAAFTTWTLIGIFIILIILSVVGVVALFGSGVGEAGLAATAATSAAKSGGTAIVKGGIPWLTIGFLIFALVLVSLTGFLAVFAANNIRTSPEYKPDIQKIQKAYINCIIAASMCLGAGGILIIGLIIYFFVGLKNKQKAKALQAELDALRAAKIEEVKQIRLETLKAQAQRSADLQERIREAREEALIRRAAASLPATPRSPPPLPPRPIQKISTDTPPPLPPRPSAESP